MYVVNSSTNNTQLKEDFMWTRFDVPVLQNYLKFLIYIYVCMYVFICVCWC